MQTTAKLVLGLGVLALSVLSLDAFAQGQRGAGAGAGRGNEPAGARGAQAGGRQGLPAGRGRGRGQAMPAGMETRSYQFEPTGETLEYLVYVPRKVDEDEPAPLVLALHGAGSGPGLIVNALADEARRRGYIIVGPMGYTATGWYGWIRPTDGEREKEISRLSEIDVMNVLGFALEEFNVDDSRVYVVGSSMGALGALHLGATYPDRFAAVASAAAPLAGTPDDRLANLATVPVAMLHGTEDPIPVEQIRLWVERMREQGVAVQYYEMEGANHSTPINRGQEIIFDFLDEQARQ